MKEELLQNGMVLLQADGLFPLGTDAVVLADFVRGSAEGPVCDLCAGSGAVGLLLLAAGKAGHVTAVELQKQACAIMAQTRAANGLEDRLRIIEGDVRQIRSLLPQGSFRCVVCNPPYYPVGSGRAPESPAQAVARTELCCTPEDFCAAAAWLLPTGGSFWLVHRPERLAELCCTLREHGLEPKALRPVCPRPEAAPSLLLLRAVRGGKPGLLWHAPLLLADASGAPSPEYRRIYTHI